MNLKARATVFTIAIFSGLVYLFAWSPLLTVKSIETTGIPATISQNLLVTKSGISLGERLARIEPRSAENALQELSWIEKADVSRNWINGKVSLKISARVPVGLYQGKGLDAAGEIFEIAGEVPKGLPVVGASTPELGLNAIELFTRLPADIRDSIISMGANNDSAISSWQKFDGRTLKVMWGSAQQVDLKVSVFRALLALPENKAVKRIDLSAPHAPIVK